MKKQLPLACVMGDMDLVRPLGLAGIPCAAVTFPGMPPRYSRFTRAALDLEDCAEHGGALVDRLVRFGAAQPAPPILFYEEDGQLLLVSRCRERLAEAFRFVIPDAELVEDLVDKSRFQALAERLDLPVPPACHLYPAEMEWTPDLGLCYPIIVKPLTRRKPWGTIGGASKAVLIESPLELRNLWPRIAESRMHLIAQELVPGPESRVESYHVYVDSRGEIAGEFTGRKIRTHPAEFGHSTALEITDTADVAELGRELTRRLALRGVAKFDFKRAADGALYLLEVNPRFNLWHHPGAKAGVNLPALVYADLAGLPRPPAARARPGARWCRAWSDWPPARAAGLSFPRWLAWTLRCEAKSAISLDDPMPFVHGALQLIRDRSKRAGQ